MQLFSSLRPWLDRNLSRSRSVLDVIQKRITPQYDKKHFKARLSYKEVLFYEVLCPYLHGSDLVFYDIGAAIGNVASMAGKLKNVKVVYAFEPISESYQKLSQRVKALKNVRCFNIALGNQNATTEFHQCKSSDSSSLLPMADLHRLEFPHTANMIISKVEQCRLDDFRETHKLLLPDIVKIDVQGYEKEVLLGGEATIRHCQVCILEMSLVELYQGSALFHEMYEFMRRWGFTFAGFGGKVIGSSGEILQVDSIFKAVR